MSEKRKLCLMSSAIVRDKKTALNKLYQVYDIIIVIIIIIIIIDTKLSNQSDFSIKHYLLYDCSKFQRIVIMYNYVVTAHKPSTVLGATTGSFTLPNVTNLILKYVIFCS